MNRFKSLLAAGAAAAATLGAPAQQPASNPVAWVNPFIGTANGGDAFPGATMPFGMVQFSPEESPLKPGRPLISPGGYDDRGTMIRGFSLTNVEGWGCGGGAGDVPLLPVTAAITDSPSSDFRNAYAVGFSHAHEEAHPGDYRVTLNNGVAVQLTASTHTGAASLAYPAGQPANLLVRTSDSEVGSTAAATRVDVAAHTVSGEVTSGNFCGYINKEDRRSYYTLHYVMQFDEPFQAGGAWQDGTVTPDATQSQGGTGYGAKGWPEKGHGSGAWIRFPSGATVHMRVGVSYVSEANALANLQAESPSGTPFATIRQRAVAAWNRRLGQIEIAGGTHDQQVVFTTALYHALQVPTTASDANGDYRGMDGQVHRLAPGQHTQYANFSGWDVYRSQVQLLTWLDPEVGSDIAQSLLNQADQNHGAWDRWTHNSGATHVMNGDPAAPAVAGIWAFGGRGFEAARALRSLVHAADVPTADDLRKDGCEVECVGERPALDQWLTLHYIPTHAPAWGPAADTLEDATAEFGLAALANHLGDRATASRFLGRAQYWRNLWNPRAAPDGGYIMNRNADGTWALVQDDDKKPPVPFTPATGDGFVEGSAAQYVWMIPFNVRGLFDAMGGLGPANARLDRFFYDEHGKMAVTNAGPLHAELNNEPSIGTPWLYDFAGKPWKTQELVREVLRELWVNEPKGIPGNDDLGEMSSWAVFASMGLYPAIPGRAELVLGSPLFTRITVHRREGDIVLHAPAAAPDAPYVNALKLNGQPWSKTWLPESFALHGGTLDFELSPTPARTWGTGAKDAPPSFERPAEL